MRRTARLRALTGVVTVASVTLLAACGDDDDGGSGDLDPDADLSEQSLVISNWDAMAWCASAEEMASGSGKLWSTMT